MENKRVVRGGSWNNQAQNVRAAYRNRNSPENSNENLGFRLFREHEQRRTSAPDPTWRRSGGLWSLANAEWPPVCS